LVTQQSTSKIQSNWCYIELAMVSLPSGLFVRFVQTPPYLTAGDLALAQFAERQGQTRFLANSSALQLGQAFRHLSGAAPESAEALVLDLSRGALMDAAALDDALEDLVRKPCSHLSPF
jgi:hypothetical protein